MSKVTMVIRAGGSSLSIHSKFVVPIEDVEICLSSIVHDFIGSKNQLKRLAKAHGERLWNLVEKHQRDAGFYLHDKTPIEIWNGFGVIDEIPGDYITGHGWLPPVQNVRTTAGYNMPLDGDQLEFFLREFRKALN